MSRRGQALPLALGLGLLVLAGALAVGALGLAQLAKARAQTAADTAALSAGRRLRELLPALAALPRGRRRVPAEALAAAAAPALEASGARLRSLRALPAGGWPPTEVELGVGVPGPAGTEVGASARAGLAVAAPPPGAGEACPVSAAARDALLDAARADSIALVRAGDAVAPGPSPAPAWLAVHAPGFGFGPGDGRWRYLPGCGPGPGGAVRAPAAPAALPGWVPAELRGLVLRAASAAALPPILLAALLQAESGFDARAVSPAGALGIAQFMPATAADVGLRDPFDPELAVPAAARLLAGHLRAFGSVPLALAAYNAGPGAVRRFGGVPPYRETQGYVARILALTGGLEAVAAGGGVVLIRAGAALV